MKNYVFWNIRLINIYQRFGRQYCLRVGRKAVQIYPVAVVTITFGLGNFKVENRTEFLLQR